MSPPRTSSEFEALLMASSNRVFTGVGSRRTPENVGVLMAAIARKLTDSGWVLRSGRADGADFAFESGVKPEQVRSNTEIFLPYPGFNGSASTLTKLLPACFDIAKAVHPAWERCSDFAKKAHARNACQVLGADLMVPTAFVICWTPDGAIDARSVRDAGGTRTAIVMAASRGVTVFNLQRPDTRNMFTDWVGKDLLKTAGTFVKMKGLGKSGFGTPRAPGPAGVGTVAKKIESVVVHQGELDLFGEPPQLAEDRTTIAAQTQAIKIEPVKTRMRFRAQK